MYRGEADVDHLARGLEHLLGLDLADALDAHELLLGGHGHGVHRVHAGLLELVDVRGVDAGLLQAVDELRAGLGFTNYAVTSSVLLRFAPNFATSAALTISWASPCASPCSSYCSSCWWLIMVVA